MLIRKQTRKDKILDASERLFSEQGYYGVSMRMIADEAPAALGLLTYHFPTKSELFDAIIARRAQYLNSARHAALNALVEPTLEDLLTAFFEPYRLMIETGGEGWRCYARLHAILTQDARFTDLATHHFGSVAREMIDAIGRAEPRLGPSQAVRAYVFMIGTMVSVFADTGLADRFSGGQISSHDIGENLHHMVYFVAGGIRAMALAQTRS